MSKNNATVKVTLPIPLEKDGSTITVVELAKPCAGHLRGLNLKDICEMDFAAAYTLLPRISTLNERDLLDIDVENLAPLMVEVAGFFVNMKR